MSIKSIKALIEEIDNILDLFYHPSGAVYERLTSMGWHRMEIMKENIFLIKQDLNEIETGKDERQN